MGRELVERVKGEGGWAVDLESVANARTFRRVALQ